ncbi:filamentous haemagglutinin family protein [Variovorax sp. DAIF25]|uniref:filamentous haemagglutinin family protein n=1 Tax=Variovorax sp. DAIF25 TaxID=3080983 RepID=UPI003D6A5FFE
MSSTPRRATDRTPPHHPPRATGAIPRQAQPLHPVAWAIAGLAMALATGGAQAQRAFSAGWMAQKNMAQATATATGRLPNGQPAALLTHPQAQQQRANAELQRSLDNLQLAARGIAAQQAAQAAARLAAQGEASVPDGLAEGGLRVDGNSLSAGWLNAQAPQQTQADGRTTVAIRQTGERAILNWETFNVGRNTTVEFQQQPDWAVLNRVNDPQARPSRIQGQIKADGTVLIANRNGVVFSGTSQVDTRNLVAAAARIGDEQFRNNGLYSAQVNGQPQPVFTDALGKVEVQAGARIATRQPVSVTQGGGYVLLLGHEVENAGSIATPRGQAQLAAGDSFAIRKGVGTEANTFSTTRGNEIAPQFAPDSTAGLVRNSGLIVASEGDITLAGRTVRQDGVALATTTVNARGTVHLLNSAADAKGRVATGREAVTAVLIDADDRFTALDSQRDVLMADSARLDRLRTQATPGVFDNLSRQQDRRDLSRVEIVSGGDVQFEGGSLVLATGGQVAASAARRVLVANEARLDVAGAVGVSVAMASNNVQVNIQGNEQRDAPLNRDTGKLNNANVWIDRRRLSYVPAKPGVYDSDRYYTAGGLLEVGGYLGNQPHGIGEWLAQGGTVSLGAAEVVTQRGSAINLSGGSIDVRTGYLQQSWLKGSDGRLYRLDKAPADMVFEGVYRGFEDAHARWGRKTTGYFYNPLIGPQRLLENGYTVGRDAGRLVVSAPTAVLEGDIEATVFRGPRQTQARSAAQDGYAQSQLAVARAGTLALRRMGGVGVDGAFDTRVRIGEVADVADALAGDPAAALPAERIGTAFLDAARLSGFGLGGLEIVANGEVRIERALRLADGGRLEIVAPTTRIEADVSARAGSIVVGNVAPVATTSSPSLGTLLLRDDGASSFVLAPGARLDLRGLWSNQQREGGDIDGEASTAFVDGGSLSVRMTHGSIALERGSVVDVSSGATLARNGRLVGGRGGSASLLAGAAFVEANLEENPAGVQLRLDGELRASGVLGGGTLTLQSPASVVFGEHALLESGRLAAGTAVPLAVVLAREVRIALGERLPMRASTTLTVTVQDVALADYVSAQITTPIVTGADWVVPVGVTLGTSLGSLEAGSRMPAGTRIDFIQGQLMPGTVLPSAVFPAGLPTFPYTFTQQAGERAAIPTVYAPGRIVDGDTRFAQDVDFVPAQRLDPALLQSGFSRYRLTSFGGVLVNEDLAPRMPVLRAAADARELPSGTDTARALERWLPPLYAEDALRHRLTARTGADLSLHGAELLLPGGVQIDVDPGRQARLVAQGQLTVEGRVVAPGGDIVLTSAVTRGTNALGLAPLGTSIWIGGDAVLDAAGRAYTAFDGDGLRYGIAPDGGSIRIGLEDHTRASRDFLKTTGAHVIIRPGARLDASGAYAEVDTAQDNLPPGGARLQRLAGDGGLIRIGSSRGILNDGSLRAAAGGEGAAGGTLNLALENPPGNAHRVQVMTLTQDRVASGAAAGLRPGVADGSLVDARARLSAEEVRAGGFGTLELWNRDILEIEGDLELRLPESLILRRGAFAASTAAPPARVVLAAPYVLLDGKVAIEVQAPEFLSGLVPRSTSTANSGRLDIQAELIDVRASNPFGPTGVSQGLVATPFGWLVEARPLDLHGFDEVALTSRGDVRFTNGTLETGGNLTVTAAQLYPTTGATGELRVALRSVVGQTDSYDPARRLTIRGTGAPPAMPASAFGTLTLAAATIDQGGVVRAPLGSIIFGTKPAFGIGTSPLREQMFEVLLRDGSLTSTSAAGMVMPYGGTVDNIRYAYNGQTVEYLPLGSVAGRPELYSEQFVRPGVAFGQSRITAEAGAVLDVSGGGRLTGAGFFTGRGGSVDVLRTPLVDANPFYGFSSAGAGVYALVPGFAGGYAPVAPDAGAGAPRIGQQIRFDAPVGGLPAGTYTLMPSTYALLPGAWRIELGGGSGQAFESLRASGSVRASGYLGIANTAVRDALPTAVTLTPGSAVRSLSQYNETSYADFALARAATFGEVRARLERDGQSVHIDTGSATGRALSFEGVARLRGEAGAGTGSAAALDGNLFLTGRRAAEVVASGAVATPGFVSFDAAQLSAFDAGTLIVGGVYGLRDVFVVVGSGQVPVGPHVVITGAEQAAVVVRDGARLAAGQVFLTGHEVRVERGALVDTSRSSTAGFDSSYGYVYLDSASQGANAILAVGNGVYDFAPPQGDPSATRGSITIADGAMLRTRGTVSFLSSGPVTLGEAEINARYLAMAAPAINVGTRESFAAAEAQGAIAPGVRLSQEMLERLLRPTVPGQTPIEQLTLTAGNALNFFGSVDLDLRAAHGAGIAPAVLQLNTPAVYGWGSAGDRARVATDTLIWNGLSTGAGTPEAPFASRAPGAVAPGGPGTGAGSLVVDARRIEFGYGPLQRAQDQVALDRLILGFSRVALDATERITANRRATLSVYREGADAASRRGGELLLNTPLLTGEAGSFMAYRAGDAVRVTAPQCAGSGGAGVAGAEALGAEVRLAGRSIELDTAVALPSGRLVLEAERDVRLGGGAAIDLAGRALGFFDLTRFSSGGDLLIESAHGAVEQAAGSRIDVSAAGKPAGSVRVTATGADGRVQLAGAILGASPAARESGSIDIRARSLDDFAGLNRRLNEGGVFGGRGFVVKTGDLAIGDELRANRIEVSADGGSLTVNGRIDASGEDVGSIRLAARDRLLLAPGAVLDVHGTRLALDGRGQVIEASNRAQVELASAAGTVRLDAAATIDLRSADAVARGRLEINAPRLGADGVAVDAAAGLTVRGAESIAVNAFARHAPADGVVDSAYLETLHADSRAFIDAANASGATRARLAGLRAFGDAFHLRPGLELRSEGDLTVRGELDFSGWRYGPGADASRRGSGEPGVVVLRAGGNLVINGSISDGFAPPPDTPDDFGWSRRPDGQGRMMVVADMLAPGMRSWSMRLVGGADLASADTRGVTAASLLGARGDVLLDDPHLSSTQSGPEDAISVVRTGTGYLDVLAGRDYRQSSRFGVYTAGTQIAGSEAWDAPRARTWDGSVLGYPDYEATLNARRMFFTEGGGDLLLSAQGDVRGFAIGDTGNLKSSNGIGYWLWRQGGAELGQRAAWGINLGQYTLSPLSGGIELAGFGGIGTLGGGHLSVRAGGDAGSTSNLGLTDFGGTTSALDLVVASSGRVGADGTVLASGGGRLSVDVGGRINAGRDIGEIPTTGGQLVNLRGDSRVRAGAVGMTLESGYGLKSDLDPRAVDAQAPRDRLGYGWLGLVVGDGTMAVDARGDLMALTSRDAGRVVLLGGATQASFDGQENPALTSFTLWTERSGLELFSAGGDIQQRKSITNNGEWIRYDPGRLSAIAANGSIATNITLAPSRQGRLELLARDRVSGTSAMSSGPLSALATPERPLWLMGSPGAWVAGNFYGPLDVPSPEADLYDLLIEGSVLFGHGVDRATLLHAPGSEPIRLYAVRGDILANTGRYVARYEGGAAVENFYIAGKPVQMRAGRDIIATGYIAHSGALDISLLDAGRDVLNATLDVAGPGLLDISAGRNILQGQPLSGNQVSASTLRSIGPVAEGDTRPGASIVLSAGVGAGGPDYAGFAARYFDRARLADAASPLADQAGKVAKTYEDRLLAWLRERFGYAGGAEGALAAFLALPAEQQGVLVREVFYEELRQGGREYNDPESRRVGSYLRGREAIGALLPPADAQGQPVERRGSIVFQGAAGTHTLFGGGIQVLAPGGGLTLGANGVLPPPSTGLLTQGAGEVEIFTRGSVLLGLSRIMTTFGGGILAWSAEGDINAGRGAKTTVVYTPPKRSYDALGNATLAPNVPSTGAGIATLAPIAEVPPGDVDLIAPLGTIDAGEAGIRVSGNVNLAALQVVNAANIQVKGESSGLPVVASVNVGALTSASAAASQAAMAAQDTVQRERTAARQALPSVFTVRVLGFGNEPMPGTPAAPAGNDAAPQRTGYRSGSAVQVLGDSAMGPAERNQLTPAERRTLGY